MPRPLQSSHAPNGELKENDLGSIFPILILQKGQALCLENKNSLLSIRVRIKPFVKLAAFCTDSNILLFSFIEGLSLSITTSILCFFCFGRLNSSRSPNFGFFLS